MNKEEEEKKKTRERKEEREETWKKNGRKERKGLKVKGHMTHGDRDLSPHDPSVLSCILEPGRLEGPAAAVVGPALQRALSWEERD